MTSEQQPPVNNGLFLWPQGWLFYTGLTVFLNLQMFEMKVSSKIEGKLTQISLKDIRILI